MPLIEQPVAIFSVSSSAAELAPWTRLWEDYPGAWAAMLCRFVAKVRADPARYLDWVGAHRGSNFVGDADEPEDEYVCEQCGRWFASRPALTMHSTRVHGRRCDVRHFVRDAGCPVCGRWHHTRLRAIYHVKHAPACLSAVLAGQVPRLAADLVAELDLADRAHRRAARLAGRHHRGGPGFLQARPQAELALSDIAQEAGP